MYGDFAYGDGLYPATERRDEGYSQGDYSKKTIDRFERGMTIEPGQSVRIELPIIMTASDLSTGDPSTLGEDEISAWRRLNLGDSLSAREVDSLTDIIWFGEFRNANKDSL